MHHPGCGGVLNKLHQPIPRDHLAGGNRDVVPYLKFFHANGLLSRLDAARILQEIERSPEKVHPALLESLLKQLGIGGNEIGRRDDIDHLLRDKGHHRLVMLGYA